MESHEYGETCNCQFCYMLKSKTNKILDTLPKDNARSILRIRSGSINSNNKLVSFLYELMRDHVQPGIVEATVNNSSDEECKFTNGWLALYAKDIAGRLEK